MSGLAVLGPASWTIPALKSHGPPSLEPQLGSG